ncbi:trypsin-like isoform X2 [Venturia canescens]|uniref:trypsin-like isoform X2 n=1 Tax=Venturia canescens TaxID=32260 RepID=UPI001C9C1B7E|nr:trypsin-like isoform X2 [Venturia canescens]
MNRMTFALFVLVTFALIGIHNTEAKLISRLFARNEKPDNSTTQVSSEGNNHFFEWFLGLWGQKPTTTPPPDVPKPEACPSCKCGLTNTRRRIIGGVETKINQYPWMAQLRRDGEAICGGSVINNRYVLTAAHCVLGNVTVRIGEHDKSSAIESITQDFEVEKVIRHANYDSFDFDNDIALLKLRGIIRMEGLMRPVCLAEKGLTYSGKNGIVTGWGRIQIHGPMSNKLLENSVPILSNKECRLTGHKSKQITDNMMCAGYLTGGPDSCPGDSGGPMHVVEETNEVHRCRLVGC